jgi:hypothetical protein
MSFMMFYDEIMPNFDNQLTILPIEFVHKCAWQGGQAKLGFVGAPGGCGDGWDHRSTLETRGSRDLVFPHHSFF